MVQSVLADHKDNNPKLLLHARMDVLSAPGGRYRSMSVPRTGATEKDLVVGISEQEAAGVLHNTGADSSGREAVRP